MNLNLSDSDNDTLIASCFDFIDNNDDDSVDEYGNEDEIGNGSKYKQDALNNIQYGYSNNSSKRRNARGKSTIINSDSSDSDSDLELSDEDIFGLNSTSTNNNNNNINNTKSNGNSIVQRRRNKVNLPTQQQQVVPQKQQQQQQQQQQLHIQTQPLQTPSPSSQKQQQPVIKPVQLPSQKPEQSIAEETSLIIQQLKQQKLKGLEENSGSRQRRERGEERSSRRSSTTTATTNGDKSRNGSSSKSKSKSKSTQNTDSSFGVVKILQRNDNENGGKSSNDISSNDLSSNGVQSNSSSNNKNPKKERTSKKQSTTTTTTTKKNNQQQQQPQPNKEATTQQQQQQKKKKQEEKGVGRVLGDTPTNFDLDTVSFTSANTFQKGEIVLVPRSRGGFTYGKIYEIINSTMCHHDQSIQHPGVQYRAVYPSGTRKENMFKDLSASYLGKLIPIDKLPQNVKSYIMPNALDQQRVVGQKASLKDLNNLVFSPSSKFHANQIALIPRSKGGFTYGCVLKECRVPCKVGTVKHEVHGYRVVVEKKGESIIIKDLIVGNIGKIFTIENQNLQQKHQLQKQAREAEKEKLKKQQELEQQQQQQQGKSQKVPSSDESVDDIDNDDEEEEIGTSDGSNHIINGTKSSEDEDEEEEEESDSGKEDEEDVSDRDINGDKDGDEDDDDDDDDDDSEEETILWSGETSDLANQSTSTIATPKTSAMITSPTTSQNSPLLNSLAGNNSSNNPFINNMFVPHTQMATPTTTTTTTMTSTISTATPMIRDPIILPPTIPSSGSRGVIEVPNDSAVFHQNKGRKKTPHLIVIDGPNVAVKYAGKKGFSVLAIKKALEYYTQRGFEAVAFVPESVASRKPAGPHSTKKLIDFRPMVDNHQLLEELIEKGQICLTPPQDYDDSYAIQYAKQHNALIVTNDRYNDHINSQPSESEKKRATSFIRNHCISFTFARQEFLPNPDFQFPTNS